MVPTVMRAPSFGATEIEIGAFSDGKPDAASSWANNGAAPTGSNTAASSQARIQRRTVAGRHRSRWFIECFSVCPRALQGPQPDRRRQTPVLDCSILNPNAPEAPQLYIVPPCRTGRTDQGTVSISLNLVRSPNGRRASVTLLLTITERHLRPRWTRLGRMVPSRLPVPHGGGPGHRKGQGVQRGTNGSRSWRWKSVHGRTYPTLLRARPATRCCPVHPTPKAGYIMKVHQDRIFGIFSVALGIKTTFNRYRSIAFT